MKIRISSWLKNSPSHRPHHSTANECRHRRLSSRSRPSSSSSLPIVSATFACWSEYRLSRIPMFVNRCLLKKSPVQRQPARKARRRYIIGRRRWIVSFKFKSPYVNNFTRRAQRGRRLK